MDDERADVSRLATLEESGGVCRLRFARLLPVPLALAWRAITDPERLAAWFPQRVEYLSWDGEPRLGAPVRFSMPGDRTDSFEGEVLALDPPALVELSWGTDRLRFELEHEDGETLLLLEDTFEDKGKAARDASGWHACLDALEMLLDHEDPSDPAAPPVTWSAHFAGYARRFGADAATRGPVIE